MRTHPVFLRLAGRPCVVVGGDAAAALRAVACVRAGARVTVVTAAPGPEMTALVARGDVRHQARAWHPGDLRGAFLAYASTRDPELIGRLAAEAERERVLLNVIDVPEACTFVSPAVVERGELQVAIGTGGASPGLSARLRREIETHVGPEYAAFVAILGAVRRALAADPGRAGARGEVVARLLDSPLLELVRAGRRAEIDALLALEAGDGLALERLGVALGEAA
jgi:siroheme synthase-like protein